MAQASRAKVNRFRPERPAATNTAPPPRTAVKATKPDTPIRGYLHAKIGALRASTLVHGLCGEENIFDVLNGAKIYRGFAIDQIVGGVAISRHIV